MGLAPPPLAGLVILLAGCLLSLTCRPAPHPCCRYVSALQVLDKGLADDAVKGSHKEMQGLKQELLGRVGWAHLQRGEEEAMRVRFPKAYQPF